MSATRPNENAGQSKFKLNARVVTDTGFEGRIVSILPRLETEVNGEWVPDREHAYRITNDRTTVTETESEISAA